MNKPMTHDYERLNAVLENAGVSKTIYSFTMPETEAAIDRVIDGGSQDALIATALQNAFDNAGQNLDEAALSNLVSSALYEAREAFRSNYREAWTQKQDSMHEEFFATWKKWTSPIINANWDDFAYMYPTSGASEALRETINSYGHKARIDGKSPVIHTFIGEYEGFAAYADAAGIEVITHSRADWQNAIKNIGPDDQFYISQPSAIDGNIWDDFDAFADALNTAQPKAALMLDVTYVGCVGKEFTVNATHDNIPAVIFSLSKPCGAYYHRVGGMLSKEPYPSLFGNKWFKNLMALKLGTEIMQSHSVTELPTKYAPTQRQAIAETNKALGLELAPSDVYLLGTMQPRETPSDLERYLTRGSDGQDLVRVCLTPTMAHMTDPRLSNIVRARPHEGLKP
tara:strand:- start:441 stop:1634 length:1194 start_codon:yes stop_codon:yes gene_type:complete